MQFEQVFDGPVVWHGSPVAQSVGTHAQSDEAQAPSRGPADVPA